MRRGATLALLAACAALPAAAELGPGECVLIFNAASPASRELAEFYATTRRVPLDQLLPLEAPVRESIRRGEYEALARRIRTFLQADLAGRPIRCLITFPDVPLKIEAVEPTAQDAERAAALKTRKGELEDQWRQHIDAALKTLPAPVQARFEVDVRTHPDDLKHRTNRLIVRWWEQVMQQPPSEQLPDRRRLLEWLDRAQGRAALLPLLERAEVSPARDERLAALRQQVKDADARIEAPRELTPATREFDEWLALAMSWHGLAGAVRGLEQRIERLAPTDSEAAFDSELALVLQDGYPLGRWMANPLCDSGGEAPAAAPVLMTARIDGPTQEIARRLITDAVEVERAGLTGTFYIDTRGLKDDGAYGAYDHDLRDLAAWARAHSTLPVVMDTRPEVFEQGTCPDAALYCGWYSLAHYVPALKLRRGAVAFHIASFELVSLRRPDKAYWCSGLLGDGAAATLGPTSEPYLHSFPLPSRFFGLLMTGELTLVECFARSSPFVSWRMALVGDPLYRPFAKNPQYTLDQFIAEHPSRSQTAVPGPASP